MKQRDDSEQLYNLAGKFDSLATLFFAVNTAAAMIAVLFPQFLAEWFFWIQIISAIGYVIVSFTTDSWLWFEAERSRRLDCISNGFGVNLSERKTDGYYNNPLPPSIQRYAANNFENAFYSRRTAKEMIPGAVSKIIFVLLVFIVSLRKFSEGNMVLIIAQVCFSTTFFTNQIMVWIFFFKVANVCDRFYSAFSIDGDIDTMQYEARILLCAIEYESIKAFFKIRLSTRLFKKNEEELDRKWKEVLEQMRVPSELEESVSPHREREERDNRS